MDFILVIDYVNFLELKRNSQECSSKPVYSTTITYTNMYE